MYGVCKVCGCTENDPCYHPDWGMCWWVDDTHELCSHCACPEIIEGAEHCINSAGGITVPDLSENCGTCANMLREENTCLADKCNYKRRED